VKGESIVTSWYSPRQTGPLWAQHFNGDPLMTTHERLLTAAEAAKYLHLSLHHLYRLVRSGVLPAVRFRRQLRLDPAALRGFVASGGQRPTAIRAADIGGAE
jgi:excisionase family DNA binding protein